MKVGMMALPGIACLLAGILAAPLAAQTSNNLTLTSTSTTGILPVDDVVPLIVVITGPQNWDYVSFATGLGNGLNGSGNGQLMPVAAAAGQSQTASAKWGTGSFAVVARSVPARAYTVAPDGAITSVMTKRPVWPNFAPIASIQHSADPPAVAMCLPPPIWKR